MRRLRSPVTATGVYHRGHGEYTITDEPIAAGELALSCERIGDAWRLRLPDCEDDFWVAGEADPTVSEEQWRAWEEADRAGVAA